VTVAAQVTEESGAAHIVSVCTDPQYRGRGLARRACSRIMRSAMDEGAPMLILEMYTANEAGRRAYSALGFTEVGRYASGLLAHALNS
jgi:predicted GNAT family acetyltransferase